MRAADRTRFSGSTALYWRWARWASYSAFSTSKEADEIGLKCEARERQVADFTVLRG